MLIRNRFGPNAVTRLQAALDAGKPMREYDE